MIKVKAYAITPDEARFGVFIDLSALFISMDEAEIIFYEIAVLDSFFNAALEATRFSPGDGEKQLSKKHHDQVAHDLLFGFTRPGP